MELCVLIFSFYLYTIIIIKYFGANHLSWAKKNGAIQADAKGNPGKQKKIDGKNQRCFFVRLSLDDGQDNGENSVDEGGFIDVDQYGQEELPFT